MSSSLSSTTRFLIQEANDRMSLQSYLAKNTITPRNLIPINLRRTATFLFPDERDQEMLMKQLSPQSDTVYNRKDSLLPDAVRAKYGSRSGTKQPDVKGELFEEGAPSKLELFLAKL